MFQVIVKVIVFLIGGVLLIGGLSCGVMGIAVAPTSGAYSGAAWFVGFVGLVAAGLGGLLLGLIFGLVGKKKKAPSVGGEENSPDPGQPE